MKEGTVRRWQSQSETEVSFWHLPGCYPSIPLTMKKQQVKTIKLNAHKIETMSCKQAETKMELTEYFLVEDTRSFASLKILANSLSAMELTVS